MLHLQRDWYPAIGEFAELRLHDKTVREGVIDAVTDDDAILWLAADGVHQRQLFTREDGYQVWTAHRRARSGTPERDWLPDDLGDFDRTPAPHQDSIRPKGILNPGKAT